MSFFAIINSKTFLAPVGPRARLASTTSGVLVLLMRFGDPVVGLR
jgi:hypothetical protein